MKVENGTVNAGNVNYVEGGMVVHGQNGTVVAGETTQQAVSQLWGALAETRLDRGAVAEARAHVAEIDAAVHASRPDKPRAAAELRRLVELLHNAGSLIGAGNDLIGPIHILAAWLGAHGAAILGLLPG